MMNNGIPTLKPYPAYKDSGVPWLGEIPTHWEVRRQRTIVSLLVSNVDKHTHEGEYPVRLCNYVDVYKNDVITDRIPFMRATASLEEINRFRLRVGDVVITKDSETWDDIGVPALVAYEAPDLICGYHLAILRPHKDVICGDFLLRALQSQGVAAQHYISANGVTRFGLSQDAIKSVCVPLPPLREQSAIARFLDHHDRLTRRYIRAQRRLIELLTEQKQALIQQAVTRGLDPDVPLKDSGIEWLGKIPAHWEIRRNSRIFLERNNPGRVDIPIMIVSLNSGVTIGEDIDDNGRPRRLIEERSNYKFAAEGDIAYNMMRMWQGAVGVVPTDGLVSPAYVVARPLAGTNPEYFVYLFRTGKYKNEINRNSHGIVSDRNRLYWDEFKNLVSLVPPVEEQDSIVEYIVSESTQIDRAIARAQRQIDLIREYRTRLIADVVTGKLDVRGVALSEESAVASDNLVDWIETEDLEDDVPDTEEPQEGIE